MKTSIHGLLSTAICVAVATAAHAADVSFPDSGTDLRAANKALTASETVTLATATSSMSIPEGVLNAANAKLAGFAQLSVADNALKLRIFALNSPTVVLVR